MYAAISFLLDIAPVLAVIGVAVWLCILDFARSRRPRHRPMPDKWTAQEILEREA